MRDLLTATLRQHMRLDALWPEVEAHNKLAQHDVAMFQFLKPTDQQRRYYGWLTMAKLVIPRPPVIRGKDAIRKALGAKPKGS